MVSRRLVACKDRYSRYASRFGRLSTNLRGWSLGRQRCRVGRSRARMAGPGRPRRGQWQPLRRDRIDVVTSATVTRSRASSTADRVSSRTGRLLRPTSANQSSPPRFRFRTASATPTAPTGSEGVHDVELPVAYASHPEGYGATDAAQVLRRPWLDGLSMSDR
jgi:hypothetical protein